ncbi:MAG: hypothetical protein KUG77_26125 [Nannocystaceae bacterium]|nr:hypothetical protein [Nannocystaceae bacterium]
MLDRPQVRFGDGTPCSFAPTILEDLGTLIVYAGQAGRGFGDDQSLRRRELEAEEKATAIRADLQRMLREGETSLVRAAAPSAWPEVREHARKAGGELRTLIERLQEQASTSCERTRRNLRQYQRDIAASMKADLFAYLRHAMDAARDTVTVVRRLGTTQYLDSIRYEAVTGLRVELEVDAKHCPPPQRVRSLMRKVVLQAGRRKTLFGGEKPRMLRLDSYYVVEAVLSPTAVDLRLAPRLKDTDERLLLRLRPEGDSIQGRLTMADARHEDAIGPETLSQLWDVLQRTRLQAARQPCNVVSAELDARPIGDAQDCFQSAERLIDRARPIVRKLVRHTPGSDEICVLLPNGREPDDELWVRTADLTQHLLTIPIAVRPRLSPLELLGPAQVTRESDIINLGRVLMPDAGDDSDVISLHYIPPADDAKVTQAGAPTPVLELESGDISVLGLGRDPEEKSGCYDLSKLERTGQSG